MNKHLFKKELKRNKKSIIIWTSIACGLSILILAMFPLLQKVEGSMSMSAEGMGDGTESPMQMQGGIFGGILGLYNIYYSVYIILVLGIFIMSNASNIFGKEIKLGTSEFLLTRPISRSTVYFTKVWDIIVMLIISAGLQTLLSAIGIFAFKGDTTVSWKAFVYMQIHGFSVLFFLAMVGILVIMFTNPRKNKMGLTIGAIFGWYLIYILPKLSEKTEWISYFSPFRYVESTPTDPAFSLKYWGVLGLLAAGTLIIFLCKPRFEKMDVV